MSSKFLVIGDIILDEYYHVETERMSQEADIPVWDISKKELMLGGAANVAANIKRLADDVVVHLAGITNYELLNGIDKLQIDLRHVSTGTPIVKKRFVKGENDKTIVFRADDLRKFKPADVREFEHWLFNLSAERYDFIVFSDYDKGTLSDFVLTSVMALPGKKIVDAKRVDLRPFAGADVLKINFDEYSTQVSFGPYRCVEDLFESVVVTTGKDGAELRYIDKRLSHDGRYAVHTEKFKTREANVVDVTGCGDVHTAAIAVALSRGHDIRNAVRFANSCASAMVEVFGTTRI